MALGAYGIKRPADVSVQDIQIIYHYTPSRDATQPFSVNELPSTAVLSPITHGLATGGVSGTEVLGGLYNLNLPSSVFSKKGIYTVYIRPIEIRTTIVDCGILSSLPNVKGLVFDLNSIPAQFRGRFVAQGLVGYRIEYMEIDDVTKKRANFFRIVTSNFFCQAEPATSSQPNQQSPRYTYTNSETNLIFCTLTPTSSPTNNPNAIPFIGAPGQNVIITNTFFNPTVLDIEMVDHDFDTLAIALYGNQSKSIDDGIYTLYDLSGLNNLYMQYDLYEVRDEFNDQLYEIRQNRGNNIDFSKAFNQIIV
tara:strand:+ start:315 stop:1235 length:921 start_codon:yes stop_codon:yes gene_type:complete